MIPYCVKNGDITTKQLTLFKEVQRFAERIGAADCHDFCDKAAKRFASLRHVRGKFHGYDHSWLVFREDEHVVIDGYPWACGSGPFMVTLAAMSPWRLLYKEDEVKEPGDVRLKETV